MSTPAPIIELPLTPADYGALEARWIPQKLADMAGIKRVESGSAAAAVGRKDSGNMAGLLIPYLWPGMEWTGADGLRDYRLRRDHPDLEIQADGSKKPKGKYLSPPGRGSMIYIPPKATAEHIADTKLPLIITEGEFKTLALWRLAFHGGIPEPRFLAVGISGVWNWRGTIGKDIDSTGTRVSVKGPIPDMDRISWYMRDVTIVFDADVDNNPQVKAARASLRKLLKARGANVRTFEFPVGTPTSQKGIDDYLASNGPTPVLELLSAENQKAAEDKRRATPYATRLYRVEPDKEWHKRLQFNSNYQIRGNLLNANWAFSAAPEWHGVFRWNDFRGRPETVARPPWAADGREYKEEFGDHEVNLSTIWLQQHDIQVGDSIAYNAAATVAKLNRFHPIRDYLDGLVWDGEPRIDGWTIKYLQATKDAISINCSGMWLISAVARIYNPGCQVDTTLILVGQQGLRKSGAFAVLGGEWFLEDMPTLNDKDAKLHCERGWIIEMAELSAMGRSEIEHVKAFLTRRKDTLRRPYGKLVEDIDRHCVFGGTTNNREFLQDEENRRFWPITVTVRADLGPLIRDRDQLWAEAKARYDAGERWYHEDVKVLKGISDVQMTHMATDVWHNLIERWVGNRPYVTVDEVLDDCIKVDKSDWTNPKKQQVARVLKRLGYTADTEIDSAGKKRQVFIRADAAEEPQQLRLGD